MSINVLSAMTTQDLTEGTNTPLIHIGYRGLLRDQLFNLLDFLTVQELSPESGAGSKLVKVVYQDQTTGATNRKIGEKYTPKNISPKTDTLELKLSGGSWNLDDAQVRLFRNNRAAMNQFTVGQINDKTVSTIKAFNSQFLKGDSSKDDKQVDGADRHLAKFPNMDNKVALQIAGIESEADARKVETFIKNTVNLMVGHKANVIVTTMTGQSLLQTVHSWLHRNINVIKINDVEYETFLSMKVIVLDNSDFSEEVLAMGEPFYFMKLGRLKSDVNVIIPDDNQILYVKQPNIAEGGTLHEGYVEMIHCPNFGTSGRSLARCFVKLTGQE